MKLFGIPPKREVARKGCEGVLDMASGDEGMNGMNGRNGSRILTQMDNFSEQPGILDECLGLHHSIHLKWWWEHLFHAEEPEPVGSAPNSARSNASGRVL